MGQERNCKLDYDGRTFEGVAMLETSELIFRGETRLKIVFKDMTAVKAAGGRLRIEFPRGPAVFQLGDAAAKWADKILHPPSRMDKLGVKEGSRLLWSGHPDPEFRREAAERGATFVRTKPDITFLSVTSTKEMEEIASLPPGVIWVVYPKGRTELREIDVLNAGRATGLTDVKVASFSPTHTALKFMPRKAVTR